MRFGRVKPKSRPMSLRFGNYAKASLPAAPPTLDLSAPALPSLRDIDGNDQYGDCVLACFAHILGVETGNAGELYHATTQETLALYSAVTGFNPADPTTDRGTNITDALDYVVQHGWYNGVKPLGYLSLDATNAAELRSACWLFGGSVHFGVELPDTYVSPFPSGDGFTWDVGTPNPNQGHCFMAYGYSPAGMMIDTWGIFGTFTWAAIAQLCSPSAGGEVYILITPDQLSRGQSIAPNGIAWADVVADFDAIGGQLPIPVPPTPPAPAPTGAPTLAGAQAAAAAGLSAGHWLLTREQAIAAANAGLAKYWAS